jgi:hypothetical protein
MPKNNFRPFLFSRASPSLILLLLSDKNVFDETFEAAVEHSAKANYHMGQV